MSSHTVTIPLNDSVHIRYSVRKEDGALLSLAGFTLSLVVKASPASAAPAIVTVVGTLENPDTAALFVVPPNALTAAGTFYATARVYDADESYSEPFIIYVTDHA